MVWLIFANFIGDWSLQTRWMADNKQRYWFVMVAHCIVWTACICIALEYLGLFEHWKAGFLFLGHYWIDSWKCWVYRKKPLCEQPNLKHLYIDQFLHLVQCIMVYCL